MKTNINIFNELNESFNKELEAKRKTTNHLKEADLNTYKDKDEAEYYRNKELYSNSGLERHKEAMEKARKACEDKGIKLYKDHNEKYNAENNLKESYYIKLFNQDGTDIDTIEEDNEDDDF